MKLVALRGGEPPDNAVVVIRGGANGLSVETVRRTATRNHQAFGFLGVSVFLAFDGAVESLCMEVLELARYGQIRRSTVGRLRTAGFPLLATGDAPHFDIVMPDVEEATIDRLAKAFDRPEANPGRNR